nr:hypothetical protein [Tanacetum cinerariifolium]
MLNQRIQTNCFKNFLKILQIINKELAEYINSPSWNHPTFFNDNEDHSVQYKEYLENSSKEISASNSNQEKEGPPQDSDIRQLIKEECCTKDCRKQKQNMEDTMLELVEVCRQKEFYCMHNNVDDLIESALNSKHLLINLNSQCLDKEKQEEQPTERGTLHAIAPVLPTEEPEYSLSMGYEHFSTISEMMSDEVTESSVEKLVPIPSEYEVTSEDKKECDVPVCKDSSTIDVCENHYEILSDSNNDNISSNDDVFESVEYAEASPLDSELISLEEENDVHQEDEEFDLEDILQIQDVILHEKLLSINCLIANIESLNDNPTPDRVLNSSNSFPIFEESDSSLSISDNSSPEFETFSDHTEETRSGITTTHTHDSLPEYDSFCFEIEPDQEKLTSVVMNDISDDSSNDPLLEEFDLFHASDNSIPPGIENFGYDSEGDIHFLKELLVDDSIPIPENESLNFDHHDNPSFPRPPPKPPDVEFFFYSNPDVIAEEISDKINEDEYLNPGGEIEVSTNVEDDDCFPFIFVIQNFLPYLIYPEVSPLLLSAGSEDTIFDPGFFV